MFLSSVERAVWHAPPIMFALAQVCQALPLHLVHQEEEGEGGAHNALLGKHQPLKHRCAA